MAKQALWFIPGFVLGAVLSISYEAIRFVPIAAAFGLLCFSCGAILMQFFSLRRQADGFVKKRLEDWNFIQRRTEELDARRAEFEKETSAWKADRDTAVTSEILSMSDEEFDLMLAMRKSIHGDGAKESKE